MGIFDLKRGESAEIVAIRVSGGAAERLSALGVAAGKKITVLSYSLFKTSVLLQCGYVRVGVRKSVARGLEVRRCG